MSKKFDITANYADRMRFESPEEAAYAVGALLRRDAEGKWSIAMASKSSELYWICPPKERVPT